MFSYTYNLPEFFSLLESPDWGNQNVALGFIEIFIETNNIKHLCILCGILCRKRRTNPYYYRKQADLFNNEMPYKEAIDILDGWWEKNSKNWSCGIV